MSADELSDSDLSMLKFELAEAITPIAIKGPIVKRLMTRLARVEAELKGQQEVLQRCSDNLAAERDDARRKVERLRDAFGTAHKRINFVFGATQNVSWERFLFELREGVKSALNETEGVLVLKSPLDP